MLLREGLIVQEGTVIITSLALLVAAGCGGNSASAGSNNSGGSDDVVVPIDQQNDSGLSGTATLTAEGDKTRVVIDLQTRSATVAARPQPAQIHEGSCENLAPNPAYGLTDVNGGKSTTTVDARLAELTEGRFAINVHESAARMRRYVACGDFGKGNDVSLPGYSRESD